MAQALTGLYVLTYNPYTWEQPEDSVDLTPDYIGSTVDECIAEAHAIIENTGEDMDDDDSLYAGMSFTEEDGVWYGRNADGDTYFRIDFVKSTNISPTVLALIAA